MIKKLNFLQPKPFNINTLCDDLLNQSYYFCKDFLPDDIIQKLLNQATNLANNHILTQAAVGRGQTKVTATEIRSDKTYWIDNDNNNIYEARFLEYLDTVRIHLNRTLFLGLNHIESHYAVYQKNDFYKIHRDSFKGEKNRIVSLVVYLNKHWSCDDGGFLELYTDMNDETAFTRVLPVYNHAIFFLSEEVPHQVTISHKNRYSIACWFRI